MSISGQAAGGSLGGGEPAEIGYVVCDVFTPRGLAGNQLAVFEAAEALDAGMRGALAREMNYSESVFVTAPAGKADAQLAIYTPAREIPFAGHPVLGAAAVLAAAADQTLVLETKVGAVTVQVRGAGAHRAEVWMQQPWAEAVAIDADRVRGALGAPADAPVAGYDNGAPYALLELGAREDVVAVAPDLPALAQLAYGVLVFAGQGRSWKARMFAPAVGIAEDPATGSAAGPLAVHLHAAGRLPVGDTIEIEQGAEVGRPSLLRARLQGSGDLRVYVGGQVVIVARGAFSLRRQDVERLG